MVVKTDGGQEQLLKDIHTVIAPLEKSEITGIWTETLLAELCGIEGSIWKDLNFKDYPDQSLKARQLSSKLRPYKVKPKTINLAGVHKKGYRLDELRRVINRYSQLSAPAVCVTPLPLSVCGVTEEFPDVDSESDVTDKTTLNVNVGNGSNEVTDNEAGILLNDCVWPEVDSDFESEVKTVAEKRLAIMAVQYNCTLDELLEWFSDPDDMKSIAIFTRKQLEGSVQFYLDQIDVCN